MGKDGKMRMEATLQGRVEVNETLIEKIQVEAGSLNAKPPGELPQHFAVSMEHAVEERTEIDRRLRGDGIEQLMEVDQGVGNLSEGQKRFVAERGI